MGRLLFKMRLRKISEAEKRRDLLSQKQMFLTERFLTQKKMLKTEECIFPFWYEGVHASRVLFGEKGKCLYVNQISKLGYKWDKVL